MRYYSYQVLGQFQQIIRKESKTTCKPSAGEYPGKRTRQNSMEGIRPIR